MLHLVGTDDDGCGVHREKSRRTGLDAAYGGMVGQSPDGIERDAHDVVVAEVGVRFAAVVAPHFIGIGTVDTYKGGEAGWLMCDV